MSTALDKMNFSMKYGSESHQMRMLTSTKEGSEYGKASYARQSDTPKHHLDVLVHDKEAHVRSHVALIGHKDHLDKLVDDESAGVREEVARHAYPEHHDKLMHDPDSYVRGVVARRGQQRHVDHLINDPDVNVRIKAGDRKYELSKEGAQMNRKFGADA